MIERGENPAETLGARTTLAEAKAEVLRHMDEAFHLVEGITLLAPGQISSAASRYVRSIHAGLDTDDLHVAFLAVTREDIGVDPPDVYS